MSAEQRIRELHLEGATQNGPKVREQISQQAFVLFYSRGVRAVGVDLLIERAKIAKASFYRHFPSKEALIIAYLDQRHDAWMAWLTESVSKRADEPTQQLLAIFDSLGDLFCDPEYRGCPIINAVSEVGTDNRLVLETARANKAKFRSYVENLAEQAGLGQPSALAEALMLLVDGAMVTAQRDPGPEPAIEARRVAAVLIQHWDSQGWS